MSELLRELAAFPPADAEAWQRDVARALKGRAFAEALVRTTHEGLPLEPLYTRDRLPAGGADEVPGTAPFTRGLPGPGQAPRRGWTRAIEVAHPDVERANAMVLADLEGGAERVLVRAVDARTTLSGAADDPLRLAATGRGGVWLDGAADLDRLLAGVLWPLAPVTLVVTADPAPARALFEACAALREAGGSHGVGVQIDLAAAAWQAKDTATWLGAHRPAIVEECRRGAIAGLSAWDARPLGIATTALRLAGADLVQEIAAVLGLLVAAVRAFDGQVPPAAVLRASEIRVGIGNDFFGEIAKLRALRRCLALVLDTLGLADRAGDVVITAATAEETLATRDVHVNLLRTTAQATAAVAGGADAVMVEAFDARLGGGSRRGRRLARNLHALLAEESDAGAVADPGGGSFYLEHRTEQLAEAAWRQFTAWESAGGFVAACAAGSVGAAIDARWQARAARLRTRREAVLGVSVFPQLDERRPEPDAFDAEAFVGRWEARLAVPTRDREPGPATPAKPLPVRYLGGEFEALRDAADRLSAATGAPPVVLGVLVGASADYAARLDWTRELLAAGGIRLHEHSPGEAPDAAALREIARGLDASTVAATAIVIAPDALHGTTVPAVAAALRDAGVPSIVVAGRPGPHEAALRAAGVTGFVHAGADAVSFLAEVLANAEAADGRA